MRREGRRQRPAPTRDAPHRILVVCGAAVTESQYFVALRHHIGNRRLHIKIIERAKSPDQVVSYARERLRFVDFDEVWCVFDTDHFEREGAKVSRAVSLAGEQVCLAISNPCFEYWLLLHHDDCGEAFARCNAVSERLRRHVTSYDKTELRFADFRDRIPAAIERAKKREPTGRDHGACPSSGVWMLVEKLMEQKK